MEECEIQPARIGNIEFRLTKTYTDDPHDYVEIIFWYPNSDYGHESEYIKNGEWYMKPDHTYRIHESCFKNPECCYTLATLDIEEEPDVRSVCLRPFDLNVSDKKIYEQVVRMAYQYTHMLWRTRNNL